jgi:predicted PurR-regulated permease PerM
VTQAGRSARQRWQSLRTRAEERRVAALGRAVVPWDGSVAAAPGDEAMAPFSRPPETPEDLVPPSVRYAAAWSWRILVVAAAVALLGWVAWQLRVVTFPLVVALLLAALLAPTVWRLQRAGWRPGAAAGSVVGAFVVVVVGVLVVVAQRVGGQFSQIAEQATQGIAQIQDWLARGPLHLSEQQVDELVGQVRSTLGGSDGLASGALSTAGAAAEVFAGMAIALFATFFFLYDGRRIWRWVSGLAPRGMRGDVAEAGRLAFVTLIAYVRSTLLVATFDGLFVTVVLLLLGVPLALPLGVLVFFGAFVPLVGALVSGAAAVLVAFVTQGPVVALLVLLGIIAVQQIEAHVFAPLVMGRMVRIHPLAIIVAIAVGSVVFGIIGAVVAVPLVAVVNVVAAHLSSRWEAGPPSPSGGGSVGDAGGSAARPTQEAPDG